MKSVIRLAAAAIAALTLSACETGSGAAPSAPLPATEVPANGLAPLSGQVFGDGSEATIVLLHGDVSRGGPADYMHAFARQVSARYPQATVVSLLRPGYSDGSITSTGSNHNRRDQYTAENNRLVAETLSNLKAANGAGRMIVLGHSGGAAQLGAVIGQRPGLVDGAVLVSCPCDVARWRSMRNRRAYTRSQSPSDYAASVSPSTRVIAVTGQNDDNTRPVLAQEYIASLKARGIDASYVGASGAGHGFGRLETSALTAIGQLM